MLYTTLPGTDIRISRICLGTMGYGFQVDEPEAHRQMDMALERGVQFWDTAEMYPVPVTPERIGKTEEFIGRYFTRTGKRQQVVLASKITGPNRYDFLRPKDRFTSETIAAAVDASLQRLQTDVIDLYQLHWPERNVAMFGQRGYVPVDSAANEGIERTLRALHTQVQAGKIRAIGLSNETPWGTMQFLHMARSLGLPIISTVQNAYNLLNRHAEIHLAEVCMQENVGLLPYSPLGYGVLGGRYLKGNFPAGGRFTLHRDFAMRYRLPHIETAITEYAALAQTYGISLTQLALAFLHRQPFVTSTIIGASNLAQLQENIESLEVALPESVWNEVEKIHNISPNLVA